MMNLAGAQLTENELMRLTVSNIAQATSLPALIQEHGR